MENEVKVSNQTAIGGLFWIAGWLFTMGYIWAVDISLSVLSGFQIFAMFITFIPFWPLVLGFAVGTF